MTSSNKTQRLAAYGVALNNDRILLIRATAASGRPGAWWLPGGGVEFGEHPADAVRREVLEETGLDVEVGDLLAVYSDVQFAEEIDGDLHSVRLCYRVTVVGGLLTDNAEESTELARWVPLDESLQLSTTASFVGSIIRSEAKARP